MGRASSEPAARLKLRPAGGQQRADGRRGPRSGQRAADEPSHRRRDAAVVSNRAGGLPGPIQRRAVRGAAPLRTCTRYQEPRTAPSFPASLAFSEPFTRHAVGKLEPWGRDRSRRTTCSRHGHRPRRAPGASFLPGSQPASRVPLPARGWTRGNFDSWQLEFPPRWPWEERHSTSHLASWTRERSCALLSAPHRGSGSGSGVGRISRAKRALGSDLASFCALDPPLDSGGGVGHSLTAG